MEQNIQKQSSITKMHFVILDRITVRSCDRIINYKALFFALNKFRGTYFPRRFTVQNTKLPNNKRNYTIFFSYTIDLHNDNTNTKSLLN